MSAVGDARTLTAADVEAIADAVADRLQRRDVEPAPDRLLDASEAAARLGVSRDYVYAHAADLGAIRVGDGARPRLRFSASSLDDACLSSRRTQPPASPGGKLKRTRRKSEPLGTDAELLPIRGEIRG